LVLPYLDLDEPYAAIDFDQPWDAPANGALAAETPDVYRSPGTVSERTRYVVIVGPNTLWPPNGKRMLSDVTSGHSYTIAVVEAPRSKFAWMEPSDIDFETLVSELSSDARPLLAAWIDGNATALRDLDVGRLRQLVAI
jgi:hypothetical protein